jgi:hypothetical protein
MSTLNFQHFWSIVDCLQYIFFFTITKMILVTRIRCVVLEIGTKFFIEYLRFLNSYEYCSCRLYPVCDRGHCCVYESCIGVDWYFMSWGNFMALSGIG